ncbi:MAG: hypothetical protein ACREVR_14900 [Burkholderiales bacterium]
MDAEGRGDLAARQRPQMPDAALSDDALVGMLDREGIRIARRTVAKYRESMRIPSSYRRRRIGSLRI